ncbi:MAG: pseudouridine synthase [Polyangiaceae bacterium]|jgi:tRNA pseudouridine65 synthase|nr:pseudouridine synthase [Polyangiaceae bacterium]
MNAPPCETVERTSVPGRPTAWTIDDLPLLRADDHLAVFAKPSGLLVHRGWGNDGVTALQLARKRLSRLVYPVHRLDRATSGVLVFALRSECAAAMQALFRRGSVHKCYLALVRGTPAESGTVDHAIARSEGAERAPAITDYQRLATAGDVSLVEAWPRTGRLHQVRRHFKHLRHPIVGDVRYGTGHVNRRYRAEAGLHRLALHAWAIRFPHPVTGARWHVAAEVPADLAAPLQRLGIPFFVWATTDDDDGHLMTQPR